MSSNSNEAINRAETLGWHKFTSDEGTPMVVIKQDDLSELLKQKEDTQAGCIDTTTDPDNPMLKIEIAGRLYQFTVRPVEESARSWLLDILKRQMQDIHDNAIADYKKRVRAGLSELLGV